MPELFWIPRRLPGLSPFQIAEGDAGNSLIKTIYQPNSEQDARLRAHENDIWSYVYPRGAALDADWDMPSLRHKCNANSIIDALSYFYSASSPESFDASLRRYSELRRLPRLSC